jgi:hypothetical protein
MVNRSYGHALYYPYIHFQSDEWIKAAALYYDGLTRIVPEGFALNDSETVIKLGEQSGFIRDYNPSEEAIDISENFVTILREEYSNPRSRNKLIRAIRNQVNPEGIFPVHEEKIANAVKAALPELGFPKKDPRSHWYFFDPVAGSLYMTTLAERIAEKQGVPIISDTVGYQNIIRALQFDWSNEIRLDIGYLLGSVVIKTVVPENIGAVSVEKIIEIRDNHQSERVRFYEKIQDLISDMPRINDPESIQRYVDHHADIIKDEVDGLRGSLLDSKIRCVSGLISISAPPIAINLSDLLPEFKPLIIGSGFIVAGLSLLATKALEYRQIRGRGPYSYLLSLKQELTPKSMLNRLLSRIHAKSRARD